MVAISGTITLDDECWSTPCPENGGISEQSATGGYDRSGGLRKRPGRPTVMTDQLIAAARELLAAHTVAAVARKLGVSRTTLYAHMDEIRKVG
jgi:DNA invertase Pin-like site-specific DNA recombinase